LSYPFQKEQLTAVLEEILENRPGGDVVKFSAMVGRSPAIQRIRQLMGQVADSDVNVLILGESGTGKEVVARSLHQHSSRADKPFVPVNCGAIPAELLESELFGHEKGAFTGAISSRKGRFELAEGGTLFLDEIGDMSLTMQVKLLRVLQERTFERVGGTKSIRADVRIIAATHRNLEQLIEEGQFREDLFYRLNVFPIDMPPLRERSGDVPLLVDELLQRIEQEQRGTVQLTGAAMTVLGRYSWPGNVRELSNVIERLVIMYPGQEVDVADLPDKILSRIDDLKSLAIAPQAMDTSDHYRLPGEGIDLKQHLSDVECSLIKQALDESGGVVAHAAKRLRLRRTTLVEKLRKYGLNSRRDEASVA
jgi:sigma-54 specific flagellar transcriptional regulator A